jgi:uncharacterized glyoxalase superfamily protein PhnB
MFIFMDNVDDTYAKAMAHGATSLHPVTDMPYGRSCGIKDNWGNTWWITKPTP